MNPTPLLYRALPYCYSSSEPCVTLAKSDCWWSRVDTTEANAQRTTFDIEILFPGLHKQLSMYTQLYAQHFNIKVLSAFLPVGNKHQQNVSYTNYIQAAWILSSKLLTCYCTVCRQGDTYHSLGMVFPHQRRVCLKDSCHWDQSRWCSVDKSRYQQGKFDRGWRRQHNHTHCSTPHSHH